MQPGMERELMQPGMEREMHERERGLAQVLEGLTGEYRQLKSSMADYSIKAGPDIVLL